MLRATRDVYHYSRTTNVIAVNVEAEGGYWSYYKQQPFGGFLTSFDYHFSDDFKRAFSNNKSSARFQLRQVNFQLTSFLSPRCPFTGRNNVIRETRLLLVCDQIVDLLGRWMPLAYYEGLEIPIKTTAWLQFTVLEKAPLELAFTKFLKFRVVESNGLYSRRLYAPGPCRAALNLYFEVHVTKRPSS